MQQPDLDVARRFIAALTGDAGARVVWQTFDDWKKGRNDAQVTKRLGRTIHGSLDQVAGQLQRLQVDRAGVYVTVNETRGGRRLEEDVTELRALFVDVDGTRELPARWALDPHIIVQRDATHWHAYWLLQPGEDLQRFSAAQIWLAAFYGSDPTVHDLPRVMRVPGFIHHKGDPVAVELLQADRGAYDIDDVIATHPVDWSAVTDVYVRKGDRWGIRPAAAECERRNAIQREDRQQRARGRVDPLPDGGDADLELFRRWAAQADTTPGAANSRGGIDNTAFAIACEGAGRGFARAQVAAVLMEYCERAGLTDNPEPHVERIVASAFSKPRKATPPQNVGKRRGQRGGQRSEAPRDAAPPEIPPPADEAPEPDDDGPPWGALDWDRIARQWMIAPDLAVVPMEWSVQKESFVPKGNKRVSSLPIWPEQRGVDVATGDVYWRLRWLTPKRGVVESAWLPERDIRYGEALIDLRDGPITKRTARDAAQYLTEARVAVRADDCEVISQAGWCGLNGGRRWVWPGATSGQAVEYIGDPLDSHGTVAGWRKGIETLLALPDDDGFTALACVCLSAGSPFVRMSGKRSPVIGLMCRSSSGKGSTLEYALSMWCDSKTLAVPASSTAKGIQDRAMGLPDCPILLDELQQLCEYDQRQAADALYFLANGQRRITSSRAQQAVGGERRYGVGFYAAEAPILPGLNLGVQFRVIELDGMPCPTAEVAAALQAATAHYGQIAGPMAQLIAKRPASEWMTRMREIEARYRPDGQAVADIPSLGKLRGDDAASIAAVYSGAKALASILSIDMPIVRLLAWLAQQMATQRQNTEDRETVALHTILSVLLNQDWRDEPDDEGKTSPRDRITLQQRPLAWRKRHVESVTGAITIRSIDCDPDHPALAPLFAQHGGKERLKKGWADRGWIDRQGKHMTIRRRDAGRVVRFNRHALLQLGDATDE